MESGLRPVRLAMVGGGRDAFIGAVHRAAARLDGELELIAGALSSTPERALASGRDLGLPDRRNYRDWRALLAGERELPPEQRAELVAIVTPNDSHFEIARACVEAGFGVICDKPLVHTSEQARALARAVADADAVFAVTYNYAGYPLVKEARERVRAGELGTLRKVVVEYHQGWLATALEAEGQKQAAWRTDPARSGLAGAVGDIGSHAEQLVAEVTGLELESVCADLSTFVPGRRLDDDAAILLRFRGGARGVLSVSQVCVGRENDLRLRVWGSEGAIEWQQERPDELWLQRAGEPARFLKRANEYLSEAARSACRLPPGHPEAFVEAFANIYRGAAAAVRAGAGAAGAERFGFPGIVAGARGVRFIERAVASSRRGAVWVEMDDAAPSPDAAP